MATSWKELGEVVGVLGGVVGIIGGAMGVVTSLSVRKRERQRQKEDAELWEVYVQMIQGEGNAWCPPAGSEGHRLAEKMVQKGWLKRVSPHTYMADTKSGFR